MNRRLLMAMVALLLEFLSTDVMGSSVPEEVTAFETEYAFEDERFEFPRYVPEKFPYFALNTNAVAWGATIANIGGEIWVHPHISVALDLWWCPWKISDRYSLKTLAILPEGRWWLKNDGNGSFFAVHFTTAWYNLRWKGYRYQDDKIPLLGGGITYGYRLRLDDYWGIEFFLGVGFMSMRYDRFYNITNGAKADTRITSYWGPDRLGISLSYRFAR